MMMMMMMMMMMIGSCPCYLLLLFIPPSPCVWFSVGSLEGKPASKTETHNEGDVYSGCFFLNMSWWSRIASKKKSSRFEDFLSLSVLTQILYIPYVKWKNSTRNTNQLHSWNNKNTEPIKPKPKPKPSAGLSYKYSTGRKHSLRTCVYQVQSI